MVRANKSAGKSLSFSSRLKVTLTLQVVLVFRISSIKWFPLPYKYITKGMRRQNVSRIVQIEGGPSIRNNYM